jgi:hypothetical protein
MTLRIMTPTRMTFGITTSSRLPLSITTHKIMTLSIMTPNIMTFIFNDFTQNHFFVSKTPSPYFLIEKCYLEKQHITLGGWTREY